MDVKTVDSKIGDKPPEEDVYSLEEVLNDFTTDMSYRHKYSWKRVIVHALLQISGLIGLYTAIFHAKRLTFIWSYFIGFLVGQGVSLGSHRYFSHRSYKMGTPLKFFLIFFQTMAGQNSVFTWARDHKLHHKYSDTDADPHNSNRGFFFCHMGWLITKRHPLLLEKQKEIDVSDLTSDKMVMFQYKYFLPLYFVIGVLLPISVPIYFWNETLWSSFFVAYCLRYAVVLHLTWSINSFAHLWGSKTYDKRINARQSLVAWFTTAGDGWHNYHHAFPWDYRMSENGQMVIGAILLDLLAYLGLVYDLKTASPRVILGHMKRHGDGTEKHKYL